MAVGRTVRITKCDILLIDENASVERDFVVGKAGLVFVYNESTSGDLDDVVAEYCGNRKLLVTRIDRDGVVSEEETPEIFSAEKDV